MELFVSRFTLWYLHLRYDLIKAPNFAVIP
jgi:hypothetical protein